MRQALLARPRATSPPAPAPALATPRVSASRRAGCACGGGCLACRAAAEADPLESEAEAAATRIIRSPPLPRPVHRPQQPGGPPWLQCAPDPAAGTGATPAADLSAGGAATTSPAANLPGYIVQGGEAVIAIPFYLGDVFFFRISKDGKDFATGPMSWTFTNNDLEVVATRDDGSGWLRVVADPASIGGGRDVLATLTAPNIDGSLVLRIHMRRLPDKPDAVDPALRTNVAETARVRRERAETRAELAELPRRDTSGRRETLEALAVTLQGEASTLRDERAALEAAARCSLASQEAITAALDRGADQAGRAVSRLQVAGAADPEVAEALAATFHVTAGDEAARLVPHTVDVLSTARNSMLTADSADFDCTWQECKDETTGAFVQQNQRGQTVNVCAIWLNEKIHFGLTGAGAEAQAYALLHEFVHLSGITAEGVALPEDAAEAYVDQDAWASLTPSQTVVLADAYAALAWRLGG